MGTVLTACPEEPKKDARVKSEGEPINPADYKVLFALKQVHPNNEQVLRQIEDGEPVPPDYMLMDQDVINDDSGVKVGTEKILLARKNIILAEHVDHADIDPGRPGVVFVSLSPQGAKRLENATSNMELGRDRMAVVFLDRCVIAPTVLSALSESFEISGLNDPGEAQKVAEILNAPIRK